MIQKKALVLGGGGFIGHALTKRLTDIGWKVTAVDLKHPEFEKSVADNFIIGDLRDPRFVNELALHSFQRVYQLAADMGGAGYIFTGDNDADIVHNSLTINLNVLNAFKTHTETTFFFSSSACIYPQELQTNPTAPNCREEVAYPANPDSEYGWEKLMSERLYSNYARNYGLKVKVARFHNIFGVGNTFEGGREKAPAAICRKVATAQTNDEIEIWGDGKQTRSFLAIDECLDGMELLMSHRDFQGPLNIGSDEMISINDLAKMVIGISGKNIRIKNIPGPQGVRGRNSDNQLIFKTLNWKPKTELEPELRKMYQWIEAQSPLWGERAGEK